MTTEYDFLICHQCINDDYLKHEVSKEGKRVTCSYCGKQRKGVGLDWVSERIHSVIEEHFQLTADEPNAFKCALLKDKEIGYNWEREGEPVSHLIQDLAGVDDDIASNIQEYLCEQYSGDYSSGDDYDPYGDESCYEPAPFDEYNFHDLWSDLRYEVIYRTRFFNKKAKEILDSLFNEIESLKTNGNKEIFKDIGADSEIQYVFRARVCQSTSTLDKVLINPIKELAPPEDARHGRMNPAGISVFYGATDKDTCTAEVRPPTGSTVVIGQFKILKKLILLDLSALESCYVDGSFFDPKFKSRNEQAYFLRMLVSEITKPVMPNTEELEYLPTQVIAGYLSEKYGEKIVGIIFKSSQEKGHNMVFFNGSFMIKPCNTPKDVEISINRYKEPEGECYIIRHEVAPEESLLEKEEVGYDYSEEPSFSLDVDQHLYAVTVVSTSYITNDLNISTSHSKIKLKNKSENFFLEDFSWPPATSRE